MRAVQRAVVARVAVLGRCLHRRRVAPVVHRPRLHRSRRGASNVSRPSSRVVAETFYVALAPYAHAAATLYTHDTHTDLFFVTQIFLQFDDCVSVATQAVVQPMLRDPVWLEVV